MILLLLSSLRLRSCAALQLREQVGAATGNSMHPALFVANPSLVEIIWTISDHSALFSIQQPPAQACTYYLDSILFAAVFVLQMGRRFRFKCLGLFLAGVDLTWDMSGQELVIVFE